MPASFLTKVRKKSATLVRSSLVGTVAHRLVPPGTQGDFGVLFALSQAGVPIVITPADAARHLGLDCAELGPIPLAAGRLAPEPRLQPDYFDTGELTIQVLLALCRQMRPDIVVETGVANGVSTRALLGALDENANGRLISFDVDERCADVVGGAPGNERWSFELLPERGTADALRAFGSQHEGQVGLWYHDSDHRYAWQTVEYAIARRCLAAGGVLAADDVDWNTAFADFVAADPDLTSVAIFDSTKVSGFARLA